MGLQDCDGDNYTAVVLFCIRRNIDCKKKD